MNLSEQLLKMHEMAYSRDTFVDHLRDKFLSGALGEYAKLRISRELGKGDFWSNEIKKLLSNVTRYMSKSVKIKKGLRGKNVKFNALREAILEAALAQDQIKDAKNDLSSNSKYKDLYSEHWKKINLMDLTASDLLKDMIDEFLPKFSKYAEGIEKYYNS